VPIIIAAATQLVSADTSDVMAVLSWF